jgi:DNA-binding NtrC family response regulator
LVVLKGNLRPSSHLHRFLDATQNFLSRSSVNGSAPKFEPAVRAFLLAREYPGNVRDLRQLVERMGQRHVGNGPVTVGDIPHDDRPAVDAGNGPGGLIGPDSWHAGAFDESVCEAVAGGVSLKEITRVAAETAVSAALADSNGNVAMAAKSLGVTARALQLRRAVDRLAGPPPQRAEGNLPGSDPAVSSRRPVAGDSPGSCPVGLA